MDRIKILIILLLLLLTTNVIAKQTVPGDLVVLEDLIVSGDVYGTSYFGDGSNLTGISTEAVSSINVTGNDGITVSSDNTTSDANITLGLGSISPSGLTVSGDATFNGNINGISGSDVGLGNVTNNAQVYSASSPLYVTSGDVTIDTTNLTNVDTGWILDGHTTTDYNVGIGSTNPRAKLSVMAISGLDTIATFGVAGSNSVVIDKNGNVGIGTSAPAYKLAVHNEAGSIRFAVDSSGIVRYVGGVTSTIGAASVTLGVGGGILFGNTSTNSLSRAIFVGGANAASSSEIRSTSGVGTTDYTKFTVGNNGATEAMRIVNSGNIGIGTTSPGQKLQVDGNIYPKGGSYLSGDGTTGVTVTTCTGFKNGICISGT